MKAVAQYKVHNVRVDRFGTNVPHFAGADGKLFRLPEVGHVWKWQESAKRWSAIANVVESKYIGLLRYSPFKSRCAKPLELAEGEVYLTLEQTGRALALLELPTN